MASVKGRFQWQEFSHMAQRANPGKRYAVA
jgi:hypothetical protein